MKKIIILTVMALCRIGLITGLALGLRSQQIKLDMAKNSVDDQYNDCNPNREHELIKSGKIPLPEKYNETWKNATQHWAKVGQTVSNFNSTYGIAIVAYTDNSSSLYSDFNTAAREAGKSQSSYKQYAFKDFYLLLTKALQAKKTLTTKESTPDCHEVFRGIKKIFFTASEKAVVRFGHFASSSLNKKVAQGFGEVTFFSIKTCHGVRIEDFSYYKEQEEVLIPPYEKFTVTNYTKTQKGAYIRLKSLGVSSRFNCELLNGAGFLTPVGMPFLLCSLLLTWIGSL